MQWDQNAQLNTLAYLWSSIYCSSTLDDIKQHSILIFFFMCYVFGYTPFILGVNKPGNESR